MIRWRMGVALALTLLFAVPLCLPVFSISWQWHWLWEDGPRLGALALNTAQLTLGTIALSLPLGTAAAVLLFRTDLPGRQAFRLLLILALFVPVPLIVSAWEAAFGFAGWMHLFFPQMPEQVWLHGLLPAIGISAVAALPWVVLIVGMGLSWVESELEEDGLLLTSPLQVLWTITLPRCRALIAVAAVWVALFTATEVTVSDRMQIRTFAEEARLQVVSSEGDGRALLVSLPAILLTFGLLIGAVPRLQHALPPLSSPWTPRPLLRLGRWRWLGLAFVLLVVFATALPLAGLVWKLGLHGQPPSWSAQHAIGRWNDYQRLYRKTLAANLLVAAVSGAAISAFALLACWAAERSRWLRTLLLLVMALAWSMPGPLVGLGLKQMIAMIVTWVPVPMVEDLLYRGRSYVPVAWAFALRYFPVAAACVWPIVRLVPDDLRDAARLDGAGPAAEFRLLVWPLSRAAFLWTTLVVAALCLSEIGASVLVRTPGTETFALLVIDRLHYGAESDVAALCLIFLFMIVVSAALVLATIAGLRLWKGP